MRQFRQRPRKALVLAWIAVWTMGTVDPLVARAAAESEPVWCRPPTPFTDPYPANLVDASGLFTPRFGTLSWDARDGNRLTAYTYRATGFDPASGPIWFVMHGSERNADSYLAAAAPVAERYGALAVAPYFSLEDYPTSDEYTLGVSVAEPLYTSNYDPAQWRAPHDYLHSEIEHAFEAMRTAIGGAQSGYYLFGHSAGAQFVHRLITFLPHARVLGAAAGNAGWYTMPTDGGDADPNVHMPYGLQGSPLVICHLCPLFTARMTIVLGENDTATPADDVQLRGSEEAMAQGATRLARGQTYFASGQAQALELESPFRWRLELLPNTGHEKNEVMPSAGFFLFEPDTPACAPSSIAQAQGVVINEVLFDPAPDATGDANADGVRDSNDDEFVEIVNTGSTPVCLAGWTLGDAVDPQRHRFSAGAALAPGKALVVFGGGVPTGTFAGAQVQWAAYGGRLNLSNSGDVLTLSNPTGAVLRRVSWGDCAGQTCAADHLTGSTEINGSYVRSPEPGGPWKRHRDVSGTNWSPGAHADGSAW